MEKINVLIKTNGTKAEISVNGIKLEGVVGYKFVHSVRGDSHLPRLQIELQATNVTLETDRVPELPEIYRPFYTLKD